MIKIDNSQKEYILKNLEISSQAKASLGQSNILDDDTADEIREACIYKLDFCGYDKSYNETKDGVILNRLIDILYIG